MRAEFLLRIASMPPAAEGRGAFGSCLAIVWDGVGPIVLDCVGAILTTVSAFRVVVHVIHSLVHGDGRAFPGSEGHGAGRAQSGGLQDQLGHAAALPAASSCSPSLQHRAVPLGPISLRAVPPHA